MDTPQKNEVEVLKQKKRIKAQEGKSKSFCRETERKIRHRGNRLLNLILKMNYLVPLMIFLMTEATLIQLN